ncbi:MAG: DNA helicase UvrD [Nitrospirae bacterium]|nr:DNA helicase UvrD [Nitrospirota bacterium]
MQFIADLHIHSKYSMATSRDMSPDALWKWAQLKGISVIGTGDSTHPQWMNELREKLEPAGNGLYALNKKFRTEDVPLLCRADVQFILSSEISCIYSKNGKTRKVHCIVLSKDFEDAEKLNAALDKIGNIRSDGRPILGLDAKKLLQMVLDASPDSMLIPAHIWTPHFSVFGAASGFDSMEECFEELTPNIYAIETGLSSDPSMNWQLSALDNIALLSNSDAHSASKIGREANIFNTDISYDAIMSAIKTRKGLSGTIEFFPEEGKYHYDGHRNCGVSMEPSETLMHNCLCPVCGKKMTIGVMHRVAKLADREAGYKPEGSPDFKSIIPLAEIVAESIGAGVNAKKVTAQYFSLLEHLGNEFKILLEASTADIEAASTARIAEAVMKMRSGDINIAPGYDGEFGKIKIFEKIKKSDNLGQKILFK